MPKKEMSAQERKRRKGARKKGKDFERAISNWLKAQGFMVQPAHQKTIFIPTIGPVTQSADFLEVETGELDGKGRPKKKGAMDMFAIHPDKEYTLFISAHDGTTIKDRIQKIRKVRWNYHAQRVVFIRKAQAGKSDETIQKRKKGCVRS